MYSPLNLFGYWTLNKNYYYYYMRVLGLGFTNLMGTGGVLDVGLCFGCGGVGGVGG